MFENPLDRCCICQVELGIVISGTTINNATNLAIQVENDSAGIPLAAKKLVRIQRNNDPLEDIACTGT
jgi:hypothetical protein